MKKVSQNVAMLISERPEQSGPKVAVMFEWLAAGWQLFHCEFCQLAIAVQPDFMDASRSKSIGIRQQSCIVFCSFIVHERASADEN